MTFTLSPEDGLPYETINEDHTESSPWIFVCDHASNRVPVHFDIKLDPACLETHIGYDPGAAGVTRHIAKKLGAPAILHRFTRLILDPNRKNEDKNLIPDIACDGTPLPANTGLSPEERYARIRHLHSPYHRKISDIMAHARRHHSPPRLVTIHSFTPELNGTKRPWHMGVLWKYDNRLASPFMAAMRAQTTLVIGDNEPYSGYSLPTSTFENHALELGTPAMVIELRQDTVKTPEQQEEWAERIIRALPADVPEYA